MTKQQLPKPFPTADGRWRVAVQVGQGSREHRVRRYLSGSSEAEVERKRDDLLKALSAGQRPPDRRLTVGTYLRRWLDALQVRERTAESYRSTLERHVLPRIGGIVLTQLGPLDIDEMLTSMARAGVRPPTRAYALRVLSIALNAAVTRKRLIPYNPALGADRPVVKRRRPRVLTTAELVRLRAALEAVDEAGNRTERLGPLLLLLATTGIRRGEALALTWADWDRAAGLLRVERTLLYRAGEGFERVEPKTESSKRTIRLPAVAQAALVAQAKAQAAERLRRGRAWVDNDLIFTAQHGSKAEGEMRRYGGALSGATVVHALHRVCEAAGLPPIRVHDLRHLVATRVTERVGIAAAQPVLGHADIGMTGRYAHLEPTSQAAADAIDEVFSERLEEAL